MERNAYWQRFENLCRIAFSAVLYNVVCAPDVTVVDLLDHLKERHHKFFCGLCLEHRPLFYSEQQVFVSAALKKHETQVDGHPLCRFCSKR